jgi:hypothetical protein
MKGYAMTLEKYGTRRMFKEVPRKGNGLMDVIYLDITAMLTYTSIR